MVLVSVSVELEFGIKAEYIAAPHLVFSLRNRGHVFSLSHLWKWLHATVAAIGQHVANWTSLLGARLATTAPPAFSTAAVEPPLKTGKWARGVQKTRLWLLPMSSGREHQWSFGCRPAARKGCWVRGGAPLQPLPHPDAAGPHEVALPWSPEPWAPSTPRGERFPRVGLWMWAEKRGAGQRLSRALCSYVPQESDDFKSLPKGVLRAPSKGTSSCWEHTVKVWGEVRWSREVGFASCSHLFLPSTQFFLHCCRRQPACFASSPFLWSVALLAASWNPTSSAATGPPLVDASPSRAFLYIQAPSLEAYNRATLEYVLLWKCFVFASRPDSAP